MAAKTIAICFSTGIGRYWSCLRISVVLTPRESSAWVDLSRSEANIAKACISRNCARSRRRRPATAFIAFTWAEPPTRETELPTLIAGRMPELNRSDSRKICPSVIEMTLVGM